MNVKRTRKPKKPHTPTNLVLEEIIGLTVKNGNGLASSISSSTVAYIAGCVVVLYDADSGAQSHLMVPNRKPKTLSCVAVSRDASIIAAGESGNQPAVLVWDRATLSLTCELKGHQYGVSCMALSSDDKQLVSVGFPRDGCICLWNWQSKILVAKVRESSLPSVVASVSFSSDAKFILTAGKNHLKFWKVRWSPGSRVSTRSVLMTMHGKVDLGPCKDGSFFAVTSPCWTSHSSVNHIQAGKLIPFYAVTDKGTLCIMYPGSSIINSVELQVNKCFGLSASNSLVACACNDGVVKLFSTNSLAYAGSLCHTEARRCKESNVENCKTDIKQVEVQNQPTIPDAIACHFSNMDKLVVVYDDHSLHIWDIHDAHKATRCCVLVSHSGCIWDIKNVPCENMHDSSLSCAAKGCSGGLSFATCSADSSIRLWDLALEPALPENSLSFAMEDSSAGTMRLVNVGIFQRDSVAISIPSPGFRSMAVSSDGRHLAAGDCQGNLHIFNLYTSDYTIIQVSCSEVSESHAFLASGARDGTIHLFDVHRNFNLIGSIDYHSSAVTAVKVACSGRKILSSGADRSLVLHSVVVSNMEYNISCCQKIATSATIYDMDADSQMEVALTVGQDKNIRAFNIQSGELIKLFTHDGDFGNPIKVTTDASCSYLACSYSYGCICIYDYNTGEIVARATGHSDIVTGIVFLNDCKRLVSVAADGCIFVWRLPAPISSRMLQRTKELLFQFSPECMNQTNSVNQIKSYQVDDNKWKGYSDETHVDKNLDRTSEGLIFQERSGPETEAFRFSVSRLPKWAQSKVVTPNYTSTDADSNSSKVAPVVNRGLPQDSSHLESQSPSSNFQEYSKKFSGTSSRSLSESDSSQGSPSPQETYRCGINNRWLTIHTVCMGLLNSPDTCDAKGLTVSGSTTDVILQDQVMETARASKRIKLSSTEDAIFKEDKYLCSSGLFDCTNQLSNSKPCGDDIPETSINLQVTKADGDADTSMISSQENDFFELNFGNLSEQLKMDRRRSFARRRYSSRFLVQKDLLEGRKRSSGKQARESAGAAPQDTQETTSNFMATNPSMSLLRGLHMSDSGKKDAGSRSPTSVTPISNIILKTNSNKIPNSMTGAEIPIKVNLINSIEKKEGNADKLGEAEPIRSCKEALQILEAAAENAVQSFFKLASLDNGNKEIQLYTDQAAARLPSIEKKVDAIAKLLQAASNLSNEKSQVKFFNFIRNF